MMQILLSMLVLAYLAGWVITMRHFDRKFQDCATKWEKAGNRQERELYFRCEELAHDDTGLAPLWFLRLHRWNADYENEARRRALTSPIPKPKDKKK